MRGLARFDGHIHGICVGNGLCSADDSGHNGNLPALSGKSVGFARETQEAGCGTSRISASFTRVFPRGFAIDVHGHVPGAEGPGHMNPSVECQRFVRLEVGAVDGPAQTTAGKAQAVGLAPLAFADNVVRRLRGTFDSNPDAYGDSRVHFGNFQHGVSRPSVKDFCIGFPEAGFRPGGNFLRR